MSGEGHLAVLGLGEAGGEISHDLAARGRRVLGYDIRPVEPPEGVEVVGSPEDAVRGAEAVLALVPPADAPEAARSAVPVLEEGTLYADCSSASPQQKRELARMLEKTGAEFVDLTLMGTVPGRGLSTPAFVSGSGAGRLAEMLSSLGMPVEKVSEEPGDAAGRKLLRSVFVKGMTGAIMEALEAGRAAGCEEWLWSNIVSELTGADEALVRRLVEGSYRHARRRADEMAAAEKLLRELGVTPRITEATKERLRKLAARSGNH
ncbi:MAG: NAD(P)-dependent oxidoreductase [Rubrobacteraceae bacterium]|nr:NAD(P)-dependent oxidoreductase [Rubrobacteraceae bacterium]